MDVTRARKRKRNRFTQKQRALMRRTRGTRVFFGEEITRDLTEGEKSIVSQLRRDNFSSTRQYFQSCFYTLFSDEVQGLKREHFIVEMPTETHRDERGRLHQLTGPAVVMRSGQEGYFIHGVILTKDFFYKVIKKQLQVWEILALRNSEHRSIAMQIYGYEKIIEALKGNVKVIHRQKLEHPRFKDRYYEVFNVEMKEGEHYQFYGETRFDVDREARFVKVVDHSTGKETIIRVPAIPQTETCAGAIAWTFGFEEKDYKPKMET